ncbi:hypothetical protein Sango_2813000 [Sesamum angolense]|uniref:NB-ARC domain-containing protein n=1 Tax=Sesamum angolense TaxID=2727404 RepID=A0AAE1T7H7_9LAMI|nr:hypothetical protein Sango_2813000 [Sesamum angolense]
MNINWEVEILVTTTEAVKLLLNNVVSCNIFPMSFLDADERLGTVLQTCIWRRRSLPPQLEKIGKRLLRNAEDFPLAIIVVGGLLSKSDKTQEYWEQIAEDITAVINCDKDEYCLNKIVYISVSKLIKFNGLPEGFLKPVMSKKFGDGGERKYLKDLIDRNLILTFSSGS